MIGLKDQCFGVEVEMTGITREQAATMLTRLMEKLPRILQRTPAMWAALTINGV